MSEKNVNMLEGMRCPDCKSEGPFMITAQAVFEVHDDGTDDREGGIEWRLDSLCRCKDCGMQGTVQDFTIIHQFNWILMCLSTRLFKQKNGSDGSRRMARIFDHSAKLRWPVSYTSEFGGYVWILLP